jgi:PIN domain
VAELDRYVIDTNVIINLLTNGETDNPDWYQCSHALWSAAEGGEFQACLSVVTVAEVLASPRVRGNHLERETRYQRSRKARAWMESGSFMVIDADEVLARRAGELAQEFQLKGADALILASAERVRAPFLFTWDKGLTKVGSQMRGLTVCAPDSPDDKHQSSLALREMGGEPGESPQTGE